MSERGDRASRIAAAWAERTHAFRTGALAPQPGLFGQFAQIVGGRLVITTDGIGTKIELAERTGVYDTLGFDLVAMVVDDLTALGAEPCVLSNVLDVSVIDEDLVDALFRGLHAAAARARVAVACGEIAELGARVAGYGEKMHCAWSATCVGVLREGWEPLDGSAIRDGQVILAVPERGFRCNGFTRLRAELTRAYGAEWHTVRAGDHTWGELLLTPSVVCAPLITALREAGVALAGVAHVTGGGIPNKLGRVLRASGLGARLAGLRPAEMLERFLALGAMGIEDAYCTFHMGPAMLLVMEEAEAARACAIASEHGFVLQPCGEIEATPGIRIEHAGCWLEFAPSPVWSR